MEAYTQGFCFLEFDIVCNWSVIGETEVDAGTDYYQVDTGGHRFEYEGVIVAWRRVRSNQSSACGWHGGAYAA